MYLCSSMCRNADDAVVGASIGLSAFLFRQCPGCVSEERHCWMLYMPVCVFCYNTHRSCSCPAQAQVLPLCEAQLVCCWCVCIGFPAACSGGVAALLLHSAQQLTVASCVYVLFFASCILPTHLCSSANCSQTACQMPLECMASVGRIIQTSANTGSCGDESVCCVNIRTAHPVLFGDTSCWCTV